jgi:hypothetical protein
MKVKILLFVLFVCFIVLNARSQCPAPGVTSPVMYCQNEVAVPLTATGTNLLWGNATPGVAGGTSALTTSTYIDATYSNRKLNFTTTKPNVTISSVDYYIPAYQSAWGLKLSIYNSTGTIIATSSTTTYASGGASGVKITNTFNYTIVAAGNYSIGVSAGLGNIGSDHPSYPITEPTGTINITGGSSSGLRCFNNIKFPADASSTAPTPSTATPGTFNYTVTQTVGGCTSTPATIAVIVTAIPAATISYSGGSFCSTQAGTVAVTRTGTSGGTYSSSAGLSINESTGAISPSASTAGTYTVSYTMIGTGGCTDQVATTSVIIKAAPAVVINKTETCLGANTGTITATASGNIDPYSYSLNGAAYQSSGSYTGLSAGNYTLNVKGNTGCVTSNVVSITQPANATDDQSVAGNDEWVGHMYDGTNFSNYAGQFSETETFTESFGSSAGCFDIVSAGNTRSVYTESFSVKFRMNSSKRGLYAANLGSDDGARLSVNGTMIFNNWTDHSFNTNTAVLMNLTGSSSLLYEYYENGGDNQVIFQNFNPLISNTLSANTTQAVCIGNAAAAISGDVFGTLPGGITLSGTGYQWTYSTSPGGARINISGATGATFTPSTSTAPFNAAGTYYVYRTAKLSSSNNISYSPYVASNESNAAVIIISGGGQWTGSVSTDWATGGNWCTGVAPTSAVDVIIKSTAVRMPEVITTGSCKSLTIEAGASVNTLITGTLNIAGVLTNNGTMSNNGTTNFNGSVQQTFSGINSFYNLTVNNAAGVLLPSNIGVNNNLLIAGGVLNANNFSMDVKGNWTNNASATAFAGGTGTVSFSGTTAQLMAGSFSTRFNNLTIANTGNAVSLNANAVIQGNLNISSGTFDLTSFTANRETSGGTLMLANNAFLKIGGTNSFPTNFTTNSLIVASTVEYNGTNQTVANQVYGNLVLSSSAGSAVKTLPATALTIVGNFSSIKGAGTDVTYTAGAAITVNGNVSIGTATTFNAASFSHTMGANWVNAGTFNGNTGTITFNGTGSNISGSGSQNFNNLTIASSLITISNNAVTLSGNLATTGSGSFSLPVGGTLTMTGTGKTISGFGISIDNLSITGSVNTSSSLAITGNLSVTGSFVSSAGVITMSGASKIISGAGTKSFSSLYVTGSVTTNADFSISSALNINGTFVASAGTVTFTGTSSLTGKASLFNTNINGTLLRMSSASTLGIANAMTITSGILDVTSSTPNTVDFNGTGAQNINAIAYDNLKLSEGNTKTAIAGLTVYRDITIAASTHFAPGDFTHAVYGDWYNYGSFTPGLSTIVLIGNLNAHIYGATIFNILTINNSTAATTITLHNNVGASVVNMVSGTLLTDTNTLTITNTRTGNGIILGHITRTHAFTTGVAYAFEGPNNTIEFSSASSVNSITVSASRGSIADFPYNSAISRLYDIAIPSGTYTAALRLHYEDAELNGNNEATMGLWHYNGTYWLPVDKSANSTSDNYVEQVNITNLSNRWTCGFTANVAEWSGAVSSDWHVAGNWTVLQGSPSTPPGIDDVAVIGFTTFNNQPTISTAVNVKNIVFGSAKAISLSMAAGGVLESGDIIGLWDSVAVHSINVNDQTVNIAGNLALSDGTNDHNINLNIGTGNLNVLGSLYQFGGAGITFTGAGNMSIRDDYNYINGSFTAGSGTVTYNGSVNQTVAPVSYNNLTINKINSHALITDSTHIAGDLTVTGDLETYAGIVISGNVNIQPDAIFENYSTLRVGGHWNNNGSYLVMSPDTRIIFNGTSDQNISASTFNNLEIDKPVGSAAVLTGDIILKGDLLGRSGTIDIGSYFFNRDNVGGSATLLDSGTLIIGADNAPNNFSTYLLGAASTLIFNGTDTQHLVLDGITCGNLVFRNSGAKILYTPLDVAGNFSIESGAIFDAGANTISLNGNWINSGTYVPGTSTLLGLGNLKTISGNNTFNRLIVSGSYTFLHNNTMNDLLNITATGNLNGGSGIVTTMNGDLINSGILYTLGTTTFTGNVQQTLSLINAVQTVAITVNFNGTVPPVLNSTSPPQYGFLNINNTGGVNASVGYAILYGLSVGAGASFNAGGSAHNIYGYLNNNGTITSSGTINFLPATATSINLGTNFSSTGSVVFGGTGAMTVSGTPLSLKDVMVSNSHASGVTASSDWTLTNSLTINSGSVFNAGNHQFSIAGIIDNGGTINSGTSTFKLNGILPQTIYSASAFHNLVVETESEPVSLLTDVTVNNTLSFVKGNIITGSYKLILSDAGVVSNASQTTGWVNGNLQKGIAAGATQRVFETGDANYYTPVSLELQNVTTGGSLLVTSVSGDHSLLAESRINVYKSVNRYWKLTNNAVVFTACDAAFQHPFSDVDGSAATATFGGSIYNDISWEVAAASSSNDTITVVTTTTLTGDFAIGEVCNKNTEITYSASHFCTTSTDATPLITGNGGGVFSSETGITINPVTGVVTPSSSTPGEYKIVYTIAATGECAEYTTTTTVFIDQAPLASISYATGPYCSGAGVIYPAFSGTTGGVFSASNGLYIDPLTGRIDLGSNTAGNYDVTYSIAASGGCGAVTYTTPIEIVSPGTWIGAISSRWFDAGNWMCDIIPGNGANVNFDSGSVHYPLIDSGLVSLNNLSVASGASVTIIQATLKVSGVINNSGSIDAAAGTLELAGNVPQTIAPGSFLNNSVSSLIISNISDSGVVLSGPLDVYNTLTFSEPGTGFTTNDFLTLKSNSTGTARVGNMTGVNMTGNVTVENYIPARKSWYFLSSATNSSQSVHQSWQEGAVSGNNPAPGFGTQITSNRSSWQADGFDAYSAGPSIKKYDPVSNAWVGLVNTNASNIKSTEGYMIFVRGDRTITAGSSNTVPTVLRTKGSLYTGDLQPVTVGAHKSVSVGNPYVAPLDLRKLSKTGVKDFFYVWDPNLGGTYGVGGYQVFSADSTGNYVVVPGGGSYGAGGSVSNYIASGLAFFVNGDSTGGSINFNENAKYDPEDLPVSSGERSGILVNLLSVNADSSEVLSDGLLVNFDNSFNNGIDNGDAIKYTNAGENISTLTAAKSLIVERRNLIASRDTIYLKVSNLKVKKYRLSIAASRLDAGGRTGTLIDNYTGTRTMLHMNGNTLVNFTVTSTAASYASNRFKIVFDKMTVLPVKFVGLKAYTVSNNSINVDWQTAEEVNTNHYDVERSHDGTNFSKILSTPVKGNNGAYYSLNDPQPFADVNYYRIKAVENTGEVLYSNVVKVSMQQLKPGISVFPNPVADGKTSLQLNNMAKGNCKVKLFSNTGQEVFSSNIKNTGSSGSYPLEIGRAVSAGIYQLTLTDANGNRYTIELIIQGEP